MRITDLLDKRAISLDAAPKTKNECLDMAVDLMVKSGKINDREAYRKQVYAREEESTTGIGDGIAIPHGKCDAVTKPGLAAMVIRNGVDFDSLDGEPVTLLFLIAAPNTEDNIHLQVLSKLSMLLMDDEFTAKLRAAKSVDEFIQIVDETDEKEKDVDERLAGADSSETTADTGFPVLLAVTSCPTGIAHTYMAAEGLEKAAKKVNVKIKVETRGSGGAKNVITDEEIQNAKAVIVAADAKVPMDRFDGKKVIVTQVSDGISKADELVDRALNGEVPVYHAANGAAAASSSSASGSGAWHNIYTWLMNGVSHMLPFVVGGGILIALSFLIDSIVGVEDLSGLGTTSAAAALFNHIGNVAFYFMLPVLSGFIAEGIGDRPALAVGFVGGMLAKGFYISDTLTLGGKSGFIGALVAGFAAGFIILGLEKLCQHLPTALEKIAPVLIYPLVGILAIGLLSIFVIEPIFGGINSLLTAGLSSMTGVSKVVLGMIVGGMMSVDMGGPFNKASYVFSTGMLAAGEYDIMAACMIGGMVPPCAIALSSLLFKDKWEQSARDNALSNFIMGLAFISEAAIPYAAADPGHVLPSCIIGSAAAGAISMAAGCTLMAPHGGIFVFPVVGNWPMYIVALIAGTVISAVLLGVTRKKVSA